MLLCCVDAAGWVSLGIGSPEIELFNVATVAVVAAVVAGVAMAWEEYPRVAVVGVP